jgi:hypothetical protein
MKPISIPKENITQLFSKQNIATLEELKIALGTNVAMTVFRKLKELDYITSCSHRGKYYTLKNIAQFNNDGFWFQDSVMFSSHGSLVKTAQSIIDASKQGFTANLLSKQLGLSSSETLLTLFRNKKLYREKVKGEYIYFSSNNEIKKQQKINRISDDSNLSLKNISPEILMNELKAAIIIFFSTLNEKQRRLYAGLESLKLGKKGNQIIADLLEINIKTVVTGKKELFSNSIDINSIRSQGGGRKKKKKIILT